METDYQEVEGWGEWKNQENKLEREAENHQEINKVFSNHESHLLLWSHTFATIVILDLTPYLSRWYVRIYPSIIMSKSLENKLLTIFQKLSQKVNNLKWPQDDLCPHIIMLMHHVRLYPRIILSNSHGNM